MLQLPGVFQTSGWLPSLLVMAVCAVWTTVSGMLLARGMSLFPGNATFNRRLEFGKAAFYLLPRWLYYIAWGTLVFVFFTQNLANILVTAQTMDSMILASAGKTCAIVMDPSAQQRFTCVTGDTQDSSTDSLFGSDQHVLTIGYAVTLIVTIPLGIMNLDDNIGIQIGGMLLTFLCVIVWVLNFWYMGLQTDRLPTWAPDPTNGYLQLLPSILFNYGFVTTIPSWVNEKRSSVRVTSTLIGAQLLATAQYVLTAVFAGLAIDFTDNVDITAKLNDPKQERVWLASRIMTFIFPLANILTSIPVFSIIVRYNLLQLQGVKMPVWLANLIAVYLPWFIAVPFYTGNQVSLLITWSSALLFVHINLLLPAAMFVSSERQACAGTLPLLLDDGEVDERASESGGVRGDELGVSDVEGAATGSVQFAAPRSSPGKSGARDEQQQHQRLLSTPDSRNEMRSPLLEGRGDDMDEVSGPTQAAASLSGLLDNPARLRIKFVGENGGAEGGGSPGDDAEDIHVLPAWARAQLPEMHLGVGLVAFALLTAVAALSLQVYSTDADGREERG